MDTKGIYEDLLKKLGATVVKWQDCGKIDIVVNTENKSAFRDRFDNLVKYAREHYQLELAELAPVTINIYSPLNAPNYLFV